MSANPPSTTTPGQGQPAAPYAERAITVTLSIGQGAFGASGSSSIVLKGLRVIAHVQVANMPSTGQAQVRIYGMTLDEMNSASKAGVVFGARNNEIRIEAGDALSGMAVLFEGIIVEAFPDMREAPNTAFFVLASPGPVIQLKPVVPTTYPGQAQAAQVFQALAGKAGLKLENNGVNTVLQSPYFWGTAWSQILSAIKAVNCFGYLDGVKKTLAVWPKTGNRSGQVVEVSPETGMVGYPEFQALNVRVRTRFDPTLFAGTGPGHQIKVKSELTAANGTFNIIGITHDLASQLPDGPWFTTIDATPVGAAA